MDGKDELILELIGENARISYQELGEALDMSRVAAKKRVMKLEKEGIIRGYKAKIHREEEVTMLIDIITAPGKIEDVIGVLGDRTAYIRQIFRTTLENHVHIVAVSDQSANLGYLVKMIKKKCGKDIASIKCHTVTKVIKDVNANIGCDKT